MKLAFAADAAFRPAADDAHLALQRACTALWVATLSLMTAFMHNNAPAHRCLIARKIAKNLTMLHEEEQVFTVECRMIFSNLAQRWTAKADQLALQDERPRGGIRQPVPAPDRLRSVELVRARLHASRTASDVVALRRFANCWNQSRSFHVVNQFHQRRGRKAVQEAGAGRRRQCIRAEQRRGPQCQGRRCHPGLCRAAEAGHREPGREIRRRQRQGDDQRHRPLAGGCRESSAVLRQRGERGIGGQPTRGAAGCRRPRSSTTWPRATPCRPSRRSTTATPTSTTPSSRPTARC